MSHSTPYQGVTVRLSRYQWELAHRVLQPTSTLLTLDGPEMVTLENIREIIRHALTDNVREI